MHPLRPILAILLLPGTVTLLVPGLILSSRASGFTTGLSGDARPIAAALLGLGLLGAGLVLVVTTVRHFARIGRGTLAPWDPPRHLVVIGVYRYLRNPMISGVVLILLGEALIFGSQSIPDLPMARGERRAQVRRQPLASNSSRYSSGTNNQSSTRSTV